MDERNIANLLVTVALIVGVALVISSNLAIGILAGIAISILVLKFWPDIMEEIL